MAFPKNLLADHEKIVFELRPHWVALVPSALWTVLSGVALFLGYRAIESIVDGDPSTGKSVVGGVVTVLWLWFAVLPAIRWYYTLFVLTSDRLITRAGIIAKHSKEIPLERINDVAFNQSVLDRILGAGDLMVESAGERGQTVINNVRKPEQVQLMIYKESESNSDRMFTGAQGARGAAPRAEQTVTDQIEALARLKEQGAISEMEFETKKQELLKRL
jgi:uncharacterized membrane protein YdbT with pleckstrin-like domain